MIYVLNYFIFKVKDCGQAYRPINGFVNETGTKFGDTITFGCNPGYDLVGANEAECLSTGKWSKEVPKCQSKLYNFYHIYIIHHYPFL